ncbi:hypothetical protein H4R24_000512 [Coemansia sp. RSA 988]|nr:hypothetical protein H4R24_000512 [Coemansia sp. RSA 988]
MSSKKALLSSVIFPSADDLKNPIHPRYVASKHDIALFFKAEIARRALMILAVIYECSKVLTTNGHLTDDAGMLLRVCIRPEIDKVIESNIVVLFRLPLDEYFMKRVPCPLPSASPLEKLRFEADFPSLEFESELVQACAYARDKSRALSSDLSSVNSKYAFATTFNRLWVLQMHNSYVLNLAIEDMIENPDNYTSPSDNPVRPESPASEPLVFSKRTTDNNDGM